ncbi:30S ribosomal protein S20 [candidate division TM6 bacterium RIFCSPHIGHO2_12_FULL_36_22]|nr:MAG: 30S ribosomal protein S20 [candidate division TM6 bacterium RIFCSPHIGHO2_12_FULL_36_22]
MANTKSAQKRDRQNQKRKQINLARKTDLKTAVKKVLSAVEKGDTIEKLKELMRDAEIKLARAKGKGLIHAKTASRKISRLSKKVMSIAKKK